MQTAVISSVVSSAARNKRLNPCAPLVWKPPNWPNGRPLHSPVANHKNTAYSASQTEYKRYDHYSSPPRDDRRPSTPTSRPRTPNNATKQQPKKPLIKDLARDYIAAKEEDKQKSLKAKKKPEGKTKNKKKAAKTTRSAVQTSASTRKKKHCVIL